MKHLEAGVPAQFFNMAEALFQLSLIGQMTVGHHPQAAVLSQNTRRCSDKSLPDLRLRRSALVKGREMTAALLKREPEIDFIYYSNDLIAAGGLLYLLDAGINVPGQVGLAGFNGVELLQGLPRQLATMDACRIEIGQAAAKIVLNQTLDTPDPDLPKQVTLTPKLSFGDTLRRRSR